MCPAEMRDGGEPLPGDEDQEEDDLGPEEDDLEDGADDDGEEGVESTMEVDAGNQLGSLISFHNLESVMKHIIAKFKRLEAREDKFDTQISEIKQDLGQKAATSQIDEVANQLTAQIENAMQLLMQQKEQIVKLEETLERNKVLCATIDKKLELQLKEKAVQDRVIRETQDSLQDKVSVAELNLFEAKFAGYATKLEHQSLIHKLNDYSRVEDTERLAESQKVLGTRFEDYSRTAKVEEWLQQLRDWVSEELQSYAKADKTFEKVHELAHDIKDQQVSTERSYAQMDEKIRGLSDRVTSIYGELNDDLHHRALAKDLEALQADLKNYSLQVETEAFQQDCVPKLKFCVDSIQEFEGRLAGQDFAIQRVDQLLLDKASKYDVVVANSRIEQSMNREKAMAEFTKMYERLEWIGKKLEHYVASESDRFSQLRPPDYTSTFDDINSRIALKADKADLVEMYQLKANRMDADELAKLQDIIHRQLEYLAVTSFGLSKLVLTEAKSSESKTIRMQQKSQVLMQAEALWHWILHNEPPPNLDTLRSPARAAMTRTGGGEDVKAITNSDLENDRQKRAMDDTKRRQLERKLGIDGG